MLGDRAQQQAVDILVGWLGMDEADALMIGFPFTYGLQFPTLEPQTLLFRRRLTPTPNDWYIAGMRPKSKGTVVNFAGCTHVDNTAYQYAACVAEGNGYISEFSEPTIVMVVPVNTLLTHTPNAPINIDAVPVSGGKFDVSWEYERYGQGGDPFSFTVYGGPDPDNIDYVSNLAVVEWDAQTTRFKATTGAFADGTQRSFDVRTVGKDDLNVLAPHFSTFPTRIVTARATAPADAKISGARQVK